MAVIVGGDETGLQNTSWALLNRNDRTSGSDPGHGEQIYVNVSNGNLVIQQRDVFLPSLGDDYQLSRTYNSRGKSSDAHQYDGTRWTLSTSIRLQVRYDDYGQKYFEVEYGDGSVFDYRLDPETGLYVSTDGAGAFEVLEDVRSHHHDDPAYIVTRADQTRLSFDKSGRLLQLEDTNGVTVDYVYHNDRLVQVLDDQGHVLKYIYKFGYLYQVKDENESVLVEYHYDFGRLSEVIDRYGHRTQYFYTHDGYLERIVLPEKQIVDGRVETYDRREINFEYDSVYWPGNSHGYARVLTQITDAEGYNTTFDYDFEYGDNPNSILVGQTFLGGTTTVVDALGNKRAYSNEQEYKAWRLANGYYEIYDKKKAERDPSYQAQVDAIRNAHALTYSYRQDGYITEVVDQAGFHTTYGYDDRDNLISVTDRNGWGATHSDSDYYRQLRAQLGIVDAAGNGKWVADLTQQEIAVLLEAYTSHFEYDDRGNLIESIDNADNVTTFTYTDFNKIASNTSPVGNALVESDAQLYQDLRLELGYAALVANLSETDRQALRALYTTYFTYDANQNLIERRDAGGDLTRFEYDSYGNLTRRIVFLDAADLNDPAKQQVTTYAYDGFGNNISTTDAEGYRTFSEYDHFGNLLRFTDAKGGVTRFTYDADNRLLTVTDPEGHTTINTYDAVGNRISVTDASGHTMFRVYDRNNNLLATLDPSESQTSQDRVTRYEYDVVSNRTATVDAEGRRTDYTFNTRREQVEVLTAKVADQNGQEVRYLSTFAYDGEGNRIATTDNRGFTTEIVYTQNNLIRQQTDPNGHITRFEYDANNNRVTIIAGVQLPESKRQVLRFSYDEEDQRVTHTDAEGHTTRYAYDAVGNRSALTDANGHTTEFEYDGNNRLIREIRPEVIDPVSGTPVRYSVEHRYDGNGNEIETIDENGHSTRFTFDRDNRLVMVEDANAIKTVFEYDSRHNRTAVMIGVEASADAKGHITVTGRDEAQTTRYVYDEFNQLIAQTDGVGNALAESDAELYQALRQELGYAARVDDLSKADKKALRELYTQHFSYDKVGNRIKQVDNLDRVTRFEYDGLNRLIKQTDAAEQTTRFHYDGNDNLTARIDAEGRVSEFTYDSVDRLTDTADPLNVVTHSDYDDFGNLIAETRAFGTAEARTTTFEYDLNNRVIAQTDPELSTRRFEYDAVGNRIRIIDGRGNATQFIYNALDRNIKIIDPLSFETRFEYDGAGNHLSLIDARGGITRFEYDPGNRQIAITDPEGRRTTFVYDVRGNRIEQRTAATTADEEITVFEYDAENNLRRVIDAEGGISTNDYDRVYNLIESTDANGHTTITLFDAVNRVIRTTDAEGQVTRFSYDAVGNRLSQTDALGRVTEFIYDDNDRMIRQIGADGVETHFTYDSVGNRTRITRAANTAQAASDTFTYDLDDRLIAQTDAEGNITTYTYDANDNRTVVVDPNGNATVYTYDANDRVVAIRDPEDGVVHYAYDGNGNRTQVIDARGYTTTTYYNANNEVIVAVDAEGYATSYVYDNNGNVVSQTLHMQALALPVDPDHPPALPIGAGDQTTRFDYDKLNRITERIDAEGFRTEFVYDAVGNRLQTRQYRDLAGTDIAVTYSWYDRVDREIASVTAEGYLTEFVYDAAGNRIRRTVYDERVAIPADGVPAAQPGDSGRTERFSYDLLDRQVRATSALGVHTDFEYDSRGNRIAVVEASGTGDQRRSEFVYDRADRLIESIDALGTVTRFTLDANGNVVERRDAYGTVDERLTRFAFDGNNRSVSQTDALGVVTRFAYDANGNLVRQTRAAGLPEARTETREYDGNNRHTATVNGEGERSEFVYDGAGNRIRVIEAPGLAEERSRLFEFDRDNRLIAEIDGEGVRTEYRYDGAGNRIEMLEAAGVAGEERRSLFTYDLDNRLLQSVDPLVGVTQFEYDVLGNRIRIVDENGGVQLNTFDIVGRQLTSLSAGGTLTRNTYDLRDNLLSVTTSFADGSDSRVTTWQYDLLDRRTLTVNPNGYGTVTSYDLFGNRVQEINGLYMVSPTSPDYDAGKAVLANPQIVSYEYDEGDRLVRLTDAGGTQTLYAYDAVGNRIRIVEGANFNHDRQTTFTYDLANRLLETRNPEGGITRNRYNALGQVVEKTVLQSEGSAGNRIWIHTFYEYDDNGRLAARIDGEGVRFEFEYDAVGNEIAMHSAVGTADARSTFTAYDLNNRIIAETDAEGYRRHYVYDSAGNRIRTTDAQGNVTRFYYDGDNRLISTLNAGGYITEVDYDSVGNKVEVRAFFAEYGGAAEDFVPPSAPASVWDRVTQYSYDGGGQLIRRTEADGGVYRFTYDGVGNLVREIDALGRRTDYAYDRNNRLTRLTDARGVQTLYNYDLVGNRIGIIRAANTADASSELFAYDLNNRLIQEVDGLGQVRRTFSYDKADNRVTETDANGNTLTYAYDLENRLTDFSDGEGNITTYVYDAVGNRVQEIDARGNPEIKFYNGNNQVTHLIDREGYVTVFEYDGNGNIVRQTLYMQTLDLPVDPELVPEPVASAGDQVTLFAYDSLDRVAVKTDAEGYRTRYVYDAAGNILEVNQYRDLAGDDIATTHSYFDGMNREIARITAEGYLTVFEYDAEGNRIGRTRYDQRVAVPVEGLPAPAQGDTGRVETFAYDAVDRLIRSTSALGVRTDFEYDNRGNRTATVEAAGTGQARRTDYRYDRADRLTRTTDALGTVTHLTLDANGNVVAQRDAFGTDLERLTTFVYDGNNRAVRQTDALGVSTTMAYDANGNLVATTRAPGLAEERTDYYEYDRNNRRTAEVNGEGERTESAYDGAGNRIRLTLAPGLAEERTNTFEFDRDNRLVAAVDGEGVRTEYRYDGAGNKIETLQAAGLAGQERHSYYVYDLDNRLTEVTDPMGGVTAYTYDVLGNQTQIVNANGGVQTNTFDALGRLLSSLSAGGVLTANTYDLHGNILSTTQSFADGSDARTTRYGYDALDRQTRVTDPEGFSTRIEYDVFGNQTRVSHGLYLPRPGDSGYDAAKAARAFEQSNVFVYDAADRLLSLTDGEGNITTYAYDAVGNRTRVTEAANSEPRTTTFRYDRADRLIETVTPEGGISRNRYDETGNRVTESILQSADGGVEVWIHTRFEYDGNARVTAQIDAYGVRTEFEYDAMGNQIAVRRDAGGEDERVTRSEYDLNNRVSVEIDGEGNRTEFAYDALGNRIAVTDALGRVARYYFDGSNNLIAILDAEGYINAFSYDAVGNRTGETIFMSRYGGPVDDFTPPAPTPSSGDRTFVSVFDGNSRVIERVEADGSTTTYDYDAAGNLRREEQFANTDMPRELTYAYDLNNRLIEFTDVDGTVTTFTYDGANNKTSETLTNTSDPNAVRRTLFEYDLNNRLVRETFDPTGLNLVQTIAYDLVGNAIANTDANDHTTYSQYDLANRLSRQIDALGNDTVYSYDAVGNQIAVTDANGNTTEFVYDGNDRVIQEIAPEVTVFTLDGDFQTLRPTVTRVYDAAGNEIQVTDAEGFVTTRYYDSNNRLVAELNGDQVLREWTYNAAGERDSETLYMTRLGAAAHDPAVRPSPPAGAARTTTREYDLGGRVTRIIHPAIDVTTLDTSDTDNPTDTTERVHPEERFVYDGFGNQIEIIDRNGNRTLAYYDAKDRLIAQVDAAGYLTEFDYDSQDNVIEQRVYTQALDAAGLDPSTPPAPPAGDVYQTSRVYDAASRLLEERSPAVEIFDPGTLGSATERVITRYTYDGVGNQLSRTLAAGTAQAFTEYTYYDALNRQIAVIDGNRVVSLFGYDANGNQSLAKRFFNTVDAGIDLESLTGATNFAALVGSHNSDQALRRVYDALNRLASETDLMGAGSADDLIKSFGYDANGNRTRAVDEDGFVQQFSYDALGQMIKSVGPDGSGTVYEYDTAGNQVIAFTGQLDSVPVPASNLSATLGAGLTVHWNLPSGANVQSYVVYDTVSHSDVTAYARRSAVQGTWFSTSGSAGLDTSGLAPGDQVYFRVVTQDAAGSLTWSAEQVVAVPPRLTAVSVAQTGTSTVEISATFETGVANPELLYGAPGSANTAVAFEDQGGGVYTATLTGVTNLQDLVYRIRWQDTAGNSYSGNEVPFEAEGTHAGIHSALSESAVVDGADTFYKLHIGSTLGSDIAGDFLTLAATWERTDIAGGASGSTSVEGVDSGQGSVRYDLVAGNSQPLAAGTYTVNLIGVGENEDVVLDTFEVVIGAGTLDTTRRTVSWTHPGVGDDQVVIVNGVRVDARRAGENGERLVVDSGLAGVGSAGYSAFYGTASADAHTTTVSSTEVFETDDSTDPPTQVSLGFDLGVSVTLSAAEAAAIAGDLHLAWRPAGTGTDFANDIALAASGTTFATTLAQLAAGQYDLKLYYTDTSGREVIVDWLRVDTADTSTAVTARSVAVEASETNGSLSLNAGGVLTLDPGLHSGLVGDSLGELSLSASATGQAGTSRQVDGSDAGYFTENHYNALDALIATNAENGLWREFGVDANGNTLVTRNYGLDRAGAPITSFSVYDGRNREITRIGAETTQHDGTTGRATQHLTYDVQDNVIRETDAYGGAITRTWNALGSLLTEADQLHNTRTYRYDRFGRQVAQTDALGNSRYSYYDTVGNLIEEVDGEGHSTTYQYDVFGRRTRVSNALGQSVEMTYDHRDRLIAANDAMGFTTTYGYDGRDNRTRIVDANGHESRQVWDGLGRVVDTISYQDGREIHERRAYDAYGNQVSSTDGEGRVTTQIYGAFGRIEQEIDQGGRLTFYEYDDQGRIVREHGTSGKDIRRTYDNVGRLLEVNDLATGVKTAYTYDIAGQRISEATTTPGNEHNRSVTYQYDAVGQMVRWADSVTGMHTHYHWDAAGNLRRAFTDLGYDPDGEGLDADTRFVDHVYSYDDNNRVIQVTQRGELDIQYRYDDAGNRVMVNSRGTITEYIYDDNGRVERAESGGRTTMDWDYDNVGNVLRFRTFDGDGDLATESTKRYYENNRNYYTRERDLGEDSDQTTTLTLDRAGRVLRTKLVSDGDTFYFDHFYNAAGLETRVNARGKDVKGRTTNTYNANDQLIVSNKGEGDNQDRAEVQRFVYNNDGQILYRFHDMGEDDKITRTEFAYANGNPVGQRGNTEDDLDGTETLLDTGQYNLVQALGEDFPASTVTFYSARAGDTLQSIAAAVYGNPSLWFVLAEANGLDPQAPLREGQRLQIPNTIESGRLTADTHVVYDEGEIIGSTLPNLKSDPDDGGCGGFLAIVIVAIIAVVAVIATAGLATAFLGGAAAAASATLGAQVAAFALAGAIVGAAASIVQQGLFIALGYQDEFSWKAVAAGAVSGALSGAAQGLAAAVEIGRIAATTATYAKVAARALQVASVASKQLIENGKITSWTSLATAALGPINSGLTDASGRVLSEATGRGIGIAFGISETALNFITPWAELAETAIRNDGELTMADWTSAIGATLNTAFEVTGLGFGEESIFSGFGLVSQRTVTNIAVGGGLALFDRDAGINFISHAVGNEIGQFIGQQIVATTGLARLTQIDLEEPRPGSLVSLQSPKASSASDVAEVQPVDETPLPGVIVDADGTQIHDVFGKIEVVSGDSFWKIAKAQFEQLGVEATNEEIQRQAQILMHLNPAIDPRNLQADDTLRTVEPFSGLEVSAKTLDLYQASDAEFREYLAQQARIAMELGLGGDPRSLQIDEAPAEFAPYAGLEVIAENLSTQQARSVSVSAMGDDYAEVTATLMELIGSAKEGLQSHRMTAPTWEELSENAPPGSSFPNPEFGAEQFMSVHNGLIDSAELALDKVTEFFALPDDQALDILRDPENGLTVFSGFNTGVVPEGDVGPDELNQLKVAFAAGVLGRVSFYQNDLLPRTGNAVNNWFNDRGLIVEGADVQTRDSSLDRQAVLLLNTTAKQINEAGITLSDKNAGVTMNPASWVTALIINNTLERDRIEAFYEAGVISSSQFAASGEQIGEANIDISGTAATEIALSLIPINKFTILTGVGVGSVLYATPAEAAKLPKFGGRAGATARGTGRIVGGALEGVEEAAKSSDILRGRLETAVPRGITSFNLIDQLGRGKTLLVGEGNLSFSASLVRQKGINPSNVTATTYESELAALASANRAVLESSGARVLSGVDATNLRATFQGDKFDTIIFNNPNTGLRPAQPPTKKLLEDFFGSATNNLNEGGSVIVTLKNTPFYKGFRVEEQAARAGFKLADSRVVDLTKEVPGFTHALTKNLDRSAIFPNGFVQYTFVRGSN